MNLSTRFDQIHLHSKQNRWLWLFSVFCRFSLALAFIPAGLTKILGERFASGLSVLHPMGQYLEALHHTGYYYTFIGIVQLLAAILLLIPRTVTLGAVLYFPIILNICMLSFAVRFDGSLVTAPLMTLANLYILFWNYDTLRPLFSFQQRIKKTERKVTKFPVFFFLGVLATVVFFILFFSYGYEVMPRNSLSECKKQFVNTSNETAGFQFCECIHSQGTNLNQCLDDYEGNRLDKN